MPTLNELLVEAIAANSIQTVKVLLAQGANPNTVFSNYDYSILERAAAYGSPEMIKLLLDSGANVNHIDANGYTALHWVIFNAHPHHIAELLELLLSYGAICMPSLYELAVNRGNIQLLVSIKEKIKLQPKTNINIQLNVAQEGQTQTVKQSARAIATTPGSGVVTPDVRSPAPPAQTATHPQPTNATLSPLHSHDGRVEQNTAKRIRAQPVESNINPSSFFSPQTNINVSFLGSTKKEDTNPLIIKALEQLQKTQQQQQKTIDNLTNQVNQLSLLISVLLNQQKLQSASPFQPALPVYHQYQFIQQVAPMNAFPPASMIAAPATLTPVSSSSITASQPAPVENAPLLGQQGLYKPPTAKDNSSTPLNANNNQAGNNSFVPPKPS